MHSCRPARECGGRGASICRDDDLVQLCGIFLHPYVHRVACDGKRPGFVADVVELQARSSVGNRNRVTALRVGRGSDGGARNEDAGAYERFALFVEHRSRHGVARQAGVVARRGHPVVEPPCFQLRGDASRRGVRRGERQVDVLPLLSGVLENVGFVGDLHGFRQPARTDVVGGEPPGVADVVGQRERPLAGCRGLDPHLHLAHRGRLPAAQLRQIRSYLPFAVAERFHLPVQLQHPAFELLHPGGVIFVEFLDGRQRGRHVAVAHRTVDLQQVGFRIDHRTRGLLLLLLLPDFGKLLLQRLLAGRTFEAVGVVEEPVDGRHGEFAFGGDLHALVVEVGREAREDDGRISGRDVDLPGARHLRPVDEESDFFDGGLHLRLPEAGTAAAVQMPSSSNIRFMPITLPVWIGCRQS